MASCLRTGTGSTLVAVASCLTGRRITRPGGPAHPEPCWTPPPRPTAVCCASLKMTMMATIAHHVETEAHAGTQAKTSRSCRCGPSAWSRSAMATWKVKGSATQRNSTAGDRPRPTLMHIRPTRTATHLQPCRHRSRTCPGRCLTRTASGSVQGPIRNGGYWSVVSTNA